MYGWVGGGWGGCTCLCMCALVFSGALGPQKQGLLLKGSPVWPPQLSHSSCAVHVPVVCLFYLRYDEVNSVYLVTVTVSKLSLQVM